MDKSVHDRLDQVPFVEETIYRLWVGGFLNQLSAVCLSRKASTGKAGKGGHHRKRRGRERRGRERRGRGYGIFTN